LSNDNGNSKEGAQRHGGHRYKVWKGISRVMKGSVSGDVEWHNITHFFGNGIKPLQSGTTGITSDVEWHDITFLPSRLSRIGDRLRS
jgi:hypothetical protein